MATTTHGLDGLSRSITSALHLPAVPEALQRAEQGLAAATTPADVDLAVTAYATAVATAAGGDAERLSLLRDVVTDAIAFLGPVHDVVASVVDAARAADIEVRASVSIGPARLELVAPAAQVVLATPDGRVRRVLGHLGVDGLTLDLDLGALSAKGAGFLRSPPEAAAGALLSADLGALQVVAALLVGVHDGHVRLIGLLRGEFRPTGIQLGLGFSLDAVGGVVGIGTGVDVDELRARLADGRALNALFGGTVSTPSGTRAVLDALEAMFPPRPGSTVLGPTLRLGWLTTGDWTLVRADVAVVLELPSARVVVPGRVVVEVPGPAVPLVHLRLDVLGEVDHAGRRVALDAALVDSTVLGALRVSGTAAVRMHWGDRPTTLITIGGFHPGFDPRPAVVPPQRRITIDLANPVPAGLTIHAEGYVAVGAGTLQAGARLELAFEVAGCGVRGSAALDALVQLSPLWFTAAVTGSVQLEALGETLMKVDLRGRLTGPGPLVLDVEATSEILGIDVGGRTTFVLDGTRGAAPGEPGDLRDAVARQLARPANVHAVRTSDPEVVLAPRPRSAGGAALVPPGAMITWTQSAFPLGDPVEKADGRVLADTSTVTVSVPGRPTSEVRGLLPSAAFLDLTDAEVLSVPAFGLRRTGFSIAATDEAGGPEHTVPTTYRTLRLPTTTAKWERGAWVLATGGIAAAVAAAGGPPRLTAGVGPAVRVAREPWTVVEGGAVVAGVAGSVLGGAEAHARSRVTGGTATPRAAAMAVLS